MTDERIETKVVHAGLEPDPSYGSITPPIHQTSTFVQPAPGEFAEDYDYSRYASGMAATHAVLTASLDAGDHLILPQDLYGGTYRLVDKVLARFGLAYDLVDQRDLDSLGEAIRPETRMVWVETPTNPTLHEIDLAGVVEVAGDVAVVVDNSTTKYLGGHSDVVGGAVIARSEGAHELLRFVQNSVGAVPGPVDCFLVHRGIRTLAVRMAAHTANGRAVSEFLSGVEDVRWPGFGGMICFRHPEATAIAAKTRIFSLAESLGGVESLIEVPQAMTHQSVEDSAAAVPADLVRLSCGIEAAEDLVADLEAALGER